MKSMLINTMLSTVLLSLSTAGIANAAEPRNIENTNLASSSEKIPEKMPEKKPSPASSRGFFSWFGFGDSDATKSEDDSKSEAEANTAETDASNASKPASKETQGTKTPSKLSTNKKAPDVTPDYVMSADNKDLGRLQNYLNAITTIVAEFTQIAPDGSLSSGTFYLHRPGRMRWEYHPPTPILMIAKDKNLVYYDSELEQVSHLPIDSTLAGLLAEAHINLSDKKLHIDHFSSAAGVLRIRLSHRNKPEDGSVMLEFSDTPLQIRNIVVTDAQNLVTTISLNNASFGRAIEPSLFVWKDPRKKR